LLSRMAPRMKLAKPDIQLGASLPEPIGARKLPHSIDYNNLCLWVCCLYVVSQIYMVPILVLGPSWSVWPSITDLVVTFMLVLLPFTGKNGVHSKSAISAVKRLLLIVTGGAIVSYLVLTLNYLGFKTADSFNDKGQNVGLYQIYRLCQFLAVFWFSTRIDWNAKQRLWLRRSIGLTFWLSCALILANYFDLVRTQALSPQIPKELNIAGPWAYYSLGVVGNAVGSISFHHAYPAMQILLLAAMYIYLLPLTKIWLPCAILSCLWLCGLISGSRAGFVAISVLLVAVVLSRPRQLLFLLASTAVFVVAGLYFSANLDEAFSRAVSRQQSIATSYEEDGLAGRVEIWSQRVALLNWEPALWLTGTGFGSAIESGNNGHMLYLQTTIECGLVGTGFFLFLAWKVLSFLWRLGARARVLCYLSAAILLSGLTQETLYPVPALGHYCGMYLFCIGVALSSRSFPSPRR
jgi:hypothetical protein